MPSSIIDKPETETATEPECYCQPRTTYWNRKFYRRARIVAETASTIKAEILTGDQAGRIITFQKQKHGDSYNDPRLTPSTRLSERGDKYGWELCFDKAYAKAHNAELNAARRKEVAVKRFLATVERIATEHDGLKVENFKFPEKSMDTLVEVTDFLEGLLTQPASNQPIEPNTQTPTA